MEILEIIKSIRESFGASIAIYTMGNCYQFYEILKTIYPDAEAYESGGHVFTKIENKYYDIKGESKIAYPNTLDFKPIIDKERIESLSKNKMSDERRIEFNKECFEKIKNKK